MLRCAIIGFGKMGRIRARAIEVSAQAEVVGVYDSQPLMDCRYRLFDSERAMLECPEVDAIFVCTPNYQIEPLVIAALEAGKHAFAEKPPAFTAAGVERVRAVEEANPGLKLMYGFNHRHHGSIQKIKSIVDCGEMGRILWMRGRYGKEVDESFFKGWRADPEKAGGGIMLDQGIHMLDLFLYFGGGFDQVEAFVSNLYWKIEGLEDNCFAIFRNSETGLCASLHSTMTQWRYLFSLEVFLEKGALVLNGLKTSSGAYGDEDLAIKRNPPEDKSGGFQQEERLIYHTDESWDSEIRMFFDAIQQDSPILLGNSTDALKLMQIIDGIYKRA